MPRVRREEAAGATRTRRRTGDAGRGRRTAASGETRRARRRAPGRRARRSRRCSARPPSSSCEPRSTRPRAAPRARRRRGASRCAARARAAASGPPRGARASSWTRNQSDVAPNEASQRRGVSSSRSLGVRERRWPMRAENHLAGVGRRVSTDEPPRHGGEGERREQPDPCEQERVVGRHRRSERLDSHAMVEPMGDAPPGQLRNQRQQPEDGVPGAPPTRPTHEAIILPGRFLRESCFSPTEDSYCDTRTTRRKEPRWRPRPTSPRRSGRACTRA